MTPENIEQMKAALAGATDGPWTLDGRPIFGHWQGYYNDPNWNGMGRLATFSVTAGPEHAKFNARLCALSPEMAAHIIAQNEQIAALEKRVKAADALARRMELALMELDECSLELTQENYNCPDHSLALRAYRATGEQP